MPIPVNQIALLSVAVMVPATLLFLGYRRLLLIWIGVTMFVQIFDTTILTNLPAGRIVGLLHIPLLPFALRPWLRLTPVRAWIANYAWLALLGITFGFLWPWPDITGDRPLTLTAPGRTVVYMIRILADFSLAIFVAAEIARSRRSIKVLAQSLVAGSTLNAVAAAVAFVFPIDFYYSITGLGGHVLDDARARGLSYEPRGLGLACAYGCMIVLVGRRGVSRFWPAFLALNIFALFASYSTSALATLAVMLAGSAFLLPRRSKVWIAVFILCTAALVPIAARWLPAQFEAARAHIGGRLDPVERLGGAKANNPAEAIAYRLDIFDSAALLFLLDRPLFALVGTGPSLITLPASYHVPPGVYREIWTPETGINSPPMHGLLLEVSNGGVLSLALWILQTGAMWLSLSLLASTDNHAPLRGLWQFGRALFLIGTMGYLIQVSISPVWSAFLGIGWAANRVARRVRGRTRRPAAPGASDVAPLTPAGAGGR